MIPILMTNLDVSDVGLPLPFTVGRNAHATRMVAYNNGISGRYTTLCRYARNAYPTTRSRRARTASRRSISVAMAY